MKLKLTLSIGSVAMILIGIYKMALVLLTELLNPGLTVIDGKLTSLTDWLEICVTALTMLPAFCCAAVMWRCRNRTLDNVNVPRMLTSTMAWGALLVIATYYCLSIENKWITCHSLNATFSDLDAITYLLSTVVITIAFNSALKASTGDPVPASAPQI